MSREVTENALRRMRRRALVGVALSTACSGVLASAAVAAPSDHAYEMVSPPAKFNGGAVFGQRASADGDAVAFIMNAASGGDAGAYALAPYVARRTDNGWVTRSAAPPLRAEHRGSSEVNVTAVGFAPDFSSVFLHANDPISEQDREPLASGEMNAGWDIYRYEPEGRVANWISQPDPAQASEYAAGGTDLEFAGQTNDGAHIFFQTARRLLPDAPVLVPEAPMLYESVNGEVRLVGIGPDGNHVAGGTQIGTPLEKVASERGSQAISDDGSRVYWKSQVSPSPIYLRENGDRTLLVSASRVSGSEGNLAAGTFIGASADGSVAYFFSSGRLTSDAPSAGIYRYDRDGERLTYLIRASYNAPGFASDDGRRLYFGATQALVPGAVAGRRNLYLWDGTQLNLVAPTSTSAPAQDERLRITRDGRYALFTSTSALQAPYDPTANALYRYDADRRETVCVSCHADGTLGAGESRLRASRSRYTLISEPTVVKPRNLLEDGRVFFETDEPLDPADTNEAVDVYGFDGESTTLVSTGRGLGSELADTSADGSSIFFITAEALSGWDIDGGYPDLYVSRRGPGLPEPLPPTQGCQGDTCQGQPTLAPTFGLPGTSMVDPDGSEDDPEPTEVTFSAKRPTRAQLKRFASSRQIVLSVRVSKAGSVLARATARVGKRQRALGQGWKRAGRKGTVKVAIPLNDVARRQLSKGALRVTVAVQHSASDDEKRLSLRLPGTARKGAKR